MQRSLQPMISRFSTRKAMNGSPLSPSRSRLHQTNVTVLQKMKPKSFMFRTSSQRVASRSTSRTRKSKKSMLRSKTARLNLKPGTSAFMSSLSTREEKLLLPVSSSTSSHPLQKTISLMAMNTHLLLIYLSTRQPILRQVTSRSR